MCIHWPAREQCVQILLKLAGILDHAWFTDAMCINAYKLSWKWEQKFIFLLWALVRNRVVYYYIYNSTFFNIFFFLLFQVSFLHSSTYFSPVGKSFNEILILIKYLKVDSWTVPVILYENNVYSILNTIRHNWIFSIFSEIQSSVNFRNQIATCEFGPQPIA